jgi:integrase
MPITAQFTVTLIKGRQSPYRLEIPARWSESGKRQRLFFKTKGEAEGHAALLKKKRREGKEREILLSDSVRKQAAQAVVILPEGVSLMEAVQSYVDCRIELAKIEESDVRGAVHAHVERMSVRLNSISFSKLLPMYADVPTKRTRRPKSKAYQTAIGSFSKHLEPILGGIPISEISGATLEKAVLTSTVPERSRESCFKILKAAFAFAVRRGWASSNPCDSIEWFSNDIEEARIPSIYQSEALLECADSPEILAYIALSLFAGTRDSETRRLRWENLHWDNSEIELKAAPGRKAAEGRFIRLEENLMAWLKPIQKRSGVICKDLTKDLVRYPMERVRKAADKLLKEAGKEAEATLENGWQRDLMRHGAASMWAAVHGIPKACQWLGHSEEVHRKHYRKPVSKEMAEAFYGIMQEVEPENIVAIA